jgi:transposase
VKKLREMKLKDKWSNMTLLCSKWTNHYWLCIPYKITIPTTEIFPEKLLAIDPGVRTFQTWYCSDGSHGKNGHEARKRLLSFNRKILYLQSQLDMMPFVVWLVVKTFFLEDVEWQEWLSVFLPRR